MTRKQAQKPQIFILVTNWSQEEFVADTVGVGVGAPGS